MGFGWTRTRIYSFFNGKGVDVFGNHGKGVSMKVRMGMWILTLLAVAVLVSGASAQEGEPGFSISRLVVAEKIEEREPKGLSEVFQMDMARVFCFFEARDIREDTRVSLVWMHEGQEMHETVLPLAAGARWRTWAEKSIHGLVGLWMVEVRDAEGRRVGATAFRVE
jgi:hypothetical protein